MERVARSDEQPPVPAFEEVVRELDRLLAEDELAELEQAVDALLRQRAAA